MMLTTVIPRRGALSGIRVRNGTFPCAMNAIPSTSDPGSGAARVRCVPETSIKPWRNDYSKIAYRAQQHGTEVWHGYPVGWVEVPESLRNKWRAEGRVQKKDIGEHWDE